MSPDLMLNLAPYREMIHELWGLGLTVVPRIKHADPFYMPEHAIPPDRGYQWMHLENDRVWIEQGWTAVPYERHPGLFAPFGTGGDIVVHGMGLFDKPKFEIDRERGENVAKAHKQVADWAAKAGADGLFGGARVVGFEGDTAHVTKIEVGGESETYVETIERPKERTIELVSAIPRDMQGIDRIATIFAERDRIVKELTDVVNERHCLHTRSDNPDYQAILDAFYDALQDDKALPWWPTLHAIILPYAIANVRKALSPSETEKGAS